MYKAPIPESFDSMSYVTVLMHRGTSWSSSSEWKVFITCSEIRTSVAFGNFQRFLNWLRACVTSIWTPHQNMGSRNNASCY